MQSLLDAKITSTNDWDAEFSQSLVAANDERGLETFVAAKQSQIEKYQERAKWHRRRVLTYRNAIRALVIGAVFAFVGFTIAAIAPGNAGLFWLGTVLTLLLSLAPYPLFKLRRNDVKSSILLDQFVAELQGAIADGDQNLPLAQLKARILQIETSFLNNDDELYTKKFIWQPYLDYSHDKEVYYRRGSQRRDGTWVGDKDNELVPTPWVSRYVPEMPAVWLQEDPFKLENDDRDFVFKNWQIKRKIRDLLRANDFNGRTKSVILREINEIAKGDPIVFERMLRQKKISKGLKLFKTLADLRYLTPAAKMNMVSFVDGVLQDRPYVEQCDAMRDLLRNKDTQILKYTEDFWRVHRRSLKFYALEFLAGLLIVPLLILSGAVWIGAGALAGGAVFVLGGALIVYGEMAIVTTQLRDMKAKKLTPNLVSSLIAIRHNICADAVLDDEQVYQYERNFKAAEKRFILTVTEVEPVKYAKENVSDKVLARLAPQMIQLRANKEAQARVYYEKFNHYRRMCLKFGALEAFIALMWAPVFVNSFIAFYYLGGFGFEVALGVGATLIAIALEVVAIRRHMLVARRKELYLLIYQKMAVLLSDYRLFNHPRYIAAELASLEDSIRRAAAIDNIIDVDEHIGDISAVDLGAFDDTMWERAAVMQDSPTATAPKLDVSLEELVPNHNATVKENSTPTDFSTTLTTTRRERRNGARDESWRAAYMSAVQNNVLSDVQLPGVWSNLEYTATQQEQLDRVAREHAECVVVRGALRHINCPWSRNRPRAEREALRREQNAEARRRRENGDLGWQTPEQRIAKQAIAEARSGKSRNKNVVIWGAMAGAAVLVIGVGVIALSGGAATAGDNWPTLGSTGLSGGSSVAPTEWERHVYDDVEIPLVTHAIGDEITFIGHRPFAEGGYWTMSVDSVQQIEYDMGGTGLPAEDGFVLLEVGVTVTFAHEEADNYGRLWAEVRYSTPNGVVHSHRGSDHFLAHRDVRLDRFADVYPGESTSGYVVLEVPAENWEDGFIILKSDSTMGEFAFVRIN